MAVVSLRSCLCVKSELDLFTVPPTQTSVEHGCTMDYHPVSTLTDNGPIEFNIPGSGEDYIDLTNTFLHFGSEDYCCRWSQHRRLPTQSDRVNLLMHSLFSQVDVALNDKLVSHHRQNTYAYRAYLETLLNLWKGSQRITADFSHVVQGHSRQNGTNVPVVAAGENKGLVKRASFTKSSKVVGHDGTHLQRHFLSRKVTHE